VYLRQYLATWPHFIDAVDGKISLILYDSYLRLSSCKRINDFLG